MQNAGDIETSIVPWDRTLSGLRTWSAPLTVFHDQGSTSTVNATARCRPPGQQYRPRDRAARLLCSDMTQAHSTADLR